MFLENKNKVKLVRNKLFFNEKGDVIRLIGIVKKYNVVKIYNYSTFRDEIMSHDTAVYYLQPAYRIGEVAKILDKKADTIRKYETKGLIPKARQIPINASGTAVIRVYTARDVYDLVEILSLRNKAGRPAQHVEIDPDEALRRINARFQRIKNVGKNAT